MPHRPTSRSISRAGGSGLIALMKGPSLTLTLILILTSFMSIAGAAEPLLTERSALSQGAWWNPARSGSGFEIITHGNQAGVVWYTFSADGNPVWYLAQGDLSDPAQQDWPLLQFRWASGSAPTATQAGTLRLQILSPESANVSWRLMGNSGTWSIEPLRLSGVINEVDRSGAWSDSAVSGWGLSLIEQGKLLAAALYTYDDLGNPVWLSGHDGGTRSKVELLRYQGACPWCAHRAPTSAPAGSLQLNLQSETRLAMALQPLPATRLQFPAGTHSLTQISRPASARTADRQLARFTAPTELKQILQTGMLNLKPLRFVSTGVTGISFSSPPSGVQPAPQSSANLQEAGVDEADAVRLLGNRLWTFATDGQGNTLPRLRTAVVAGQGDGISITGEQSLKAAPGMLSKAGLYLTPERLVAVTGSTLSFSREVADLWNASTAWRAGVTDIEILDTRTDGIATSLWHGRINGVLIASRRVGDRLYVVTRHVPDVPGFDYTSQLAGVTAANRALLDQTDLAALVPTLSIGGGAARDLIRIGDFLAPPLGTRGITPDVFAVTAISLDQPAVTASLGVLGIMDTVYASTNGLYLVGSRGVPMSTLPGMQTIEAPYYSDVHFIRFEGGRLALGGSGSVEGFVDQKGNNTPLRLSEHNGQLRMVTSSSSMWNNQNRNRLTILEPSPTARGLLRTVSYLPNDQRPDPLGKPGELLFATRFDNDRLYAVTFRRVDPLYVIDMGNPADPVITGELEVVGYSDYLHPLPNGLLLGLGMDAYSLPNQQGGSGVLFQGMQLSLYDVSNPRKPRELQKFIMGQRGSKSPALTNHLAFTTRRHEDGSLDIAFPGVIHQPRPGLNMTSGAELVQQPWNHTGMLRFRLTGDTPASASLTRAETFVTLGVDGPFDRPSDTAARTARAFLFPRGELYVNDGRFWLRRTDGTTLLAK